MAIHNFNWTGDIDSYDSSALSQVALIGPSVPAGKEILSIVCTYRMRIHVNGLNISYCYIELENSSGTRMLSETRGPAFVETDPSSQMRRILTFEEEFWQPEGGFEAFVQNQTSFDVAAIGAHQIEGGIADLLSVTLTVETREGWKAYYYNGTAWEACDVFLRGTTWEKQEIKYYGEASWM